MTDYVGNVFIISGKGIEVNTSSGHFLRTVKVKVPKKDLLFMEFGPYPNLISEAYWEIEVETDDGIQVIILTDALVYLNKAGNMSVSFHLNGAGAYLPKGW